MERWVANKFGLFNFWYYEEEEFQLSDGKIIFRGSNGSGKSVTTQSFIPLLLDGDKRPNRLDPFGSNARKIENYLLVDEDEEDRISYLYLEFKKPQANTYITIGMGLRARKGKKLESWYFILKDGRRVNKEVKLYKFSGQKFPLTSKQFENVLGEGNVFTTSQQEYMQKVNEHLFGYSDIDNYKDLLNLLIQLRSPKLSKDFKPTVIYEILKESLNTLSDYDLRAMAEAMDNMDSLNTKLEELRNAIESGNKIKKSLDKYNIKELYNKSYNYSVKAKEMEKLKASITKLKLEYEEKSNRVHSDNEKLKEMNMQLQSAQLKEKELEDNDGFKLRDKITNEENLLKNLEENHLKKKEQSKEKFNTRIDKENKFKKADEGIYKNIKKFNEELDEEEFYKNECYFQHGENLKNIINEKEEYDINYILESVNEHDNLVRSAYNLIVEYESKNNELNHYEEKRDNQLRLVKTKEEKFNETTEYLTNIKSEYIEKINVYINKVVELKIEPDKLTELMKYINEIYEIRNCTIVQDTIKEVGQNIKYDFDEYKLKLEHQISVLKENILELDKKINELVNCEELIDEDENVIKVKKYLKDANIPFEDFYKCINFKNKIDNDIRNNIEGSLFNMGIINSIIVPAKYKEKALNILQGNTYKVVFSDLEEEEKNVFSYFKIEESEFNNIYKEDVTSILKAISTEGKRNGRTYLSIENGFGIGIINGETSKKYVSKYIGIESREHYRKLRINELEIEKEILTKESNKISYSKEILEKRKNTLLNEISEFPKTTDIEENINLIDSCFKELEKEKNELMAIDEKLLEIKDHLDKLNINIFEATEYIKIPKNKSSYEEVMDKINTYRTIINKLKDLYKNIFYDKKTLKDLEDQIEEINYDLDTINWEISEVKDRINEKKNLIQSYKETLKSLDLGEIEKEFEIVTEIVTTYPKKINEKIKLISREETIMTGINKEIIKGEENLIKEHEILNALEEVLNNELKLKYVKEVSELDFKASLKWILNNYDSFKVGNENTLSQLFTTVNNYAGNLSDYNIRVEDIFNNYVEREDNIINDIYIKGSRVDVRVKYNKKDISIYELIDYIENAVEDHNILISSKEREVFEETLINTLSTKINAKIHKAKGWVSQIDELMRNMDTSNGFKLFLKWIPKRAESESELDIRELTEILSTPDFMTEDQREKVSNHFKEKLKKQMRIAKETGSSKVYQSIIKEVLDYRQWFEFELSCSKPLERKKELTNNEFFKLSGGEKAMSMYIPLFAAVNARYNSADKKDCPRIIALDEAFAGVDEENISNMFTLIEGLNLDYVLNSQALWGTYESVKNLSIYELIRQGEDLVLPIKYYWNGKVKTMEMDV